MTPERNAHTHDPRSSFEAANAVDALIGIHKARIMVVLRAHGPMAPEQIADFMRMERVEVARRCSDLKRDGMICVHEPLGHTNRSGRRADILAAVRT
jgi:predicted ArsR family transcriptional regulator